MRPDTLLLVPVLCLAAACSSTPTSPTQTSSASPVQSASVEAIGKKPVKGYQPFSGLVPLNPAQWTLTGSGASPLTPPGVTFTFPTVGNAGYLYFNAAQWALTTSQRLEVDFDVAAASGTVFRGDGTQPQNCVDNGYPPMAVVFFWANTFDYTEYTRWWAMDSMTPLTNGHFSLSMPLTPSRWMSALGQYGDVATRQWADSLDHVVGVGVTMGAGCYLSHGVGLTAGSASFTLTRYEIH